MKAPETEEAIRLLRTMTRVLCAVAVLALVFTTVNVTGFARSRNVPLPIAVLLDPMLGAALAVVLYADARLASWGVRPPGWSTALRWSAGCTAALMNSWESLWPDGQIGWPRNADPAAVLLHLTPALLLIMLTETIAAYRRTIAILVSSTSSAGPTAAPSAPAASTAGPIARDTDPDAATPTPIDTQHHAAVTELSDDTLPGGGADTGGHDTPIQRQTATMGQPRPHDAADAELWAHAAALDAVARDATGRPVSVWRLRTELRMGPKRAQQIRTQLLAHHRQPT